jgi:peptide deformylase
MFPDSRLRRPAAPVDVFDESLRDLAADLADTMRAAPGVGITAPHVGILRRLVVIELTGWQAARSYANPAITWQSTDMARHAEGSISMPGVSEEIERPARVRVAYQDLHGTSREEEVDGFLACCLQHEIDQLDGVFWLHRLSRLKRDRIIKRYQKTATR